MKYLRMSLAGLTAALVGGILVFAAQEGVTQEKSAPKKNELPKFNIQEKSIPRTGPNTLTFAPVVKKVTPSVVSVYSTKTVKVNARRNPLFDHPMFRDFFNEQEEQPNSRPRRHEETGLGSGVIVSENGYILTNNHVVDGADEIKVSLYSGKQEYVAQVVGKDEKTDIAILKIDAKGLPAVTMTDSDNLEVGDVVLAVGNPFGVGQTVTMGIVSATQRRGLGIVGYEDFIQTDASINPGNSGGALVDAEGRLVGIPTAIFSRSGGNQGIGFAVPVNMARFVMERLIEGGRVVRGYMGLRLQPVSADLARAFNLKSQNGAIVSQVMPGSPAAKSGLKPGDVILEFNSKKVEDDDQLRLMASQTAPGTKVPVKMFRDGKDKAIDVVLAEFPSDEAIARTPNGKSAPAPREDALEGVEVGDLDNQTRRDLGVPANIQGAVVTNVDEESPAYRAGLRPGAVIISIDQKPVKNADEAVKLSEEITNKKILLHIWFREATQFMVVDESKK